MLYICMHKVTPVSGHLVLSAFTPKMTPPSTNQGFLQPSPNMAMLFSPCGKPSPSFPCPTLSAQDIEFTDGMELWMGNVISPHFFFFSRGGIWQAIASCVHIFANEQVITFPMLATRISKGAYYFNVGNGPFKCHFNALMQPSGTLKKEILLDWKKSGKHSYSGLSTVIWCEWLARVCRNVCGAAEVPERQLGRHIGSKSFLA